MKAERQFEVVVDDIIYQSFGTAYKTFNYEKEKGVEVYHSQVKVIDVDKQEVLVNEGKKYYVVKNDEPKKEKVVLDLKKEELIKDDFVMWNKAEDVKNFGNELGYLNDDWQTSTLMTRKEEKITENTKETASVNSNGTITLTAFKCTNGVVLNWKVTNLDCPNGYKIVRGLQANPVYPGNDYKYINNEAQYGYIWEINDGKTYHFRVCQYVGGRCGVYSNDVVVTAPLKEVVKETEREAESVDGQVAAINLTVNGSSVKWTVDGYSDKGFKVVYSKNPNPTYPTRAGDKYQYFSDPEIKSTTLEAFDGPGTYYVRVCEYLGGACGVYSNQIQVELE